MPTGPVLADTITKLPPAAAGAVVVCGSHGGVYPGELAAGAGLRAVIFNDAGVGRDCAGVASLDVCGAVGMAAAAVSHAGCRIGDSRDMLVRGRISRVNGWAAGCGVAPGMRCAEAAGLLRWAPPPGAPGPRRAEEARSVRHPWRADRPLVLIDSASMVKPTDGGAFVVTGSHGGLVGGEPATALRADAAVAVFNDAGVGAGNAGISRLPVLSRRGIIAFTVACASARIGDAASTYADGVVSAVNGEAEAAGVVPGQTCRTALTSLAAMLPTQMR